MRIYIKVHPRAAQSRIVKLSEGEYEVWLTAPPVDGKANEMLIELLSDFFDISKRLISIEGGKTAKTKVVDIMK